MLEKLYHWSNETVDQIGDDQIRDWARLCLPIAQMLFLLLGLMAILGFCSNAVQALATIATYSPK